MEFKQLLIIIYHDIVSNLNIPGIYILINGTSEKFYDIVFKSIINIITDYDKININIDTIVYSESALVKIIKKYFPNSLRISCLFHLTSFYKLSATNKLFNFYISNHLNLYNLLFSPKCT